MATSRGKSAVGGHRGKQPGQPIRNAGSEDHPKNHSTEGKLNQHASGHRDARRHRSHESLRMPVQQDSDSQKVRLQVFRSRAASAPCGEVRKTAIRYQPNNAATRMLSPGLFQPLSRLGSRLHRARDGPKLKTVVRRSSGVFSRTARIDKPPPPPRRQSGQR